MDILFYIPTLRAGGAEKQCALIASYLKSHYGYNAKIIINYEEGIKQEHRNQIDSAGVELIVLPRFFIFRIIKLFCIFFQNKDAVLFNYLTYPDFIGGFFARLAGLENVVGGIETDRMYGYKFLVEKFTHKYLSKITICNSFQAYKFFTSNGFSAVNMVVMPSAIQMSGHNPQRTYVEKEDVSLVTVGRFVKAKDYFTWIDAVVLAKKSFSKLKATIIGYGELEDEIRSYIKNKGMENSIKIVDGSNINVRDALQQHDIYLSTSIREGTSNTVLEAVESGLPVVATDVGDNARIIGHGISGYVCKVKDVAALAECIVDLCERKNLRIDFGVKGRILLAKNYSLEKICSDYHELVKKIKENKHG